MHTQATSRATRASQSVLTVALLLGLWAASALAQQPAWTVVHEGNLHVGAGGGWGLSFADANNGWVIGGMSSERDVLDALVGYRTTDGGASWTDLRVPDFRVRYRDGEPVITVTGKPQTQAGPSPYSVQLLTPQEGWIGGPERLALSVDGGRTWELIHISPGIVDSPEVRAAERRGRLNVYSVYFENASSGVIMCAVQKLGEGDSRGNLALATDDGGKSWRYVAASNSGQGDGALGRGLVMASLTEGWSTSPHSLSYTTSGWQTWTSLFDAQVADIHAMSGGKMWAITDLHRAEQDFMIAHSTDGGLTWLPSEFEGELPASLMGTYAIRGLAFDNEDGSGRGWAVGAGGHILTTDDGVAWRIEATVPGIRLDSAQYIGGAVYAVGGRPDAAGNGSILRRTGVTTSVDGDGKLPTMWGNVKEFRGAGAE